MKLAIKLASPAAGRNGLHRIDEFGRGLGQKLQDFQSLVAQIDKPGFDVLCRNLDFRNALDAGCKKWVPLEEVEDAKASLALTDRVLPAVGAGQITQ